MAAFGRILRLFMGLWVLGFVASLVGAAVMKGRFASRGEPSDDDVDLIAIFEPLEFSSAATGLRRLSVMTWYGGGTVDLRGATLDPAGATLTLRAIYGGIRLLVPETWPVERNIVGIFGGVGDGRDQAKVDPTSPVLRLEGFAVFGGAGVVTEAPDIDAMPAAAPAV
jgi:hypothetical protein